MEEILLKEHLETNKHKLVGDWIKNNSSYDTDICILLDMKPNMQRYWDAIWKNLYIEFKKGNSIWIDLVRYSESLLSINPEASKETFTLFFIPNKAKNEIEEIICVPTIKLIKYLKLDSHSANMLITLNKNLPRSLNAQASLTKKDIREIAIFII